MEVYPKWNERLVDEFCWHILPFCKPKRRSWHCAVKCPRFYSLVRSNFSLCILSYKGDLPSLTAVFDVKLSRMKALSSKLLLSLSCVFALGLSLVCAASIVTTPADIRPTIRIGDITRLIVALLFCHPYSPLIAKISIVKMNNYAPSIQSAKSL